MVFFVVWLIEERRLVLLPGGTIVWDPHHRKYLTHLEQEFESALSLSSGFQKQSSRSVIKKRCSENMDQIYKRTPMLKCHFNKVSKNFIEIALRHGCSPVNWLHILRRPFLKNNSRWLLLGFVEWSCTVVITTTPRRERIPV